MDWDSRALTRPAMAEAATAYNHGRPSVLDCDTGTEKELHSRTRAEQKVGRFNTDIRRPIDSFGRQLICRLANCDMTRVGFMNDISGRKVHVMPRGDRPAVSRWRVRSALRKLRATTGETQQQVAKALSWSSAKLMRIENGQTGAVYTDVRALLDHYGVTDEATVKALSDLARHGGTRTLTHEYRDVLSKEFAEFLEQEEAAAAIWQYETKYIPGPLQTPDYARAILRHTVPPNGAEVPERTIERRVQARMNRQKMLIGPDGPQGHFMIDESAMWRMAGAESGVPTLMIDQIAHLKTLAGHDNVHIQIVPFAVGIYPALRGPFVILEFEDDGDGDELLYLENPNGEILIREDPDQIKPYREQFTRLQELGTPADEIGAYADRIVRRLRKGPTGIADLS